MSVQCIDVKLGEIKEGDGAYDASGEFMGFVRWIGEDGCLEVSRFVQPDMVKSADRYVVVNDTDVAKA